jgi:hypothetical protein
LLVTSAPRSAVSVWNTAGLSVSAARALCTSLHPARADLTIVLA